MLHSVHTSRMVQTWTEHNECPSSSCRCHFSWLRFNYTRGADCRFQPTLAYQEHIQCSRDSMKQNVSTWSSLQPLGLVHPWWSYIKNESGLFCQMQGYLWNSMFNPLCQAIYLFSAKCICDYFSVCCFFLNTELYSNPQTGGRGEWKCLI